MTKKLKWQVFPGRNRFFCNGRIVMAESISLFYLTILLISSTCALFFIFDCPYIYKHVSPVIPIIAVVLFLFTMSCFFHTAFSDPGIIPRAKPDEAAYNEQQILKMTDNGNQTQQQQRTVPKTKQIIINNIPVRIKYCYTCLMFRPPRTSHCSVCDNCVDCFDHHCPWVGNCVGRRNYKYFCMFILSVSLLCIYVLACSLTHLILISKESNIIEACKETPSSVAVFLICFISVWSILGLAGFHTFLASVNLTTNEDLRGTFNRENGLTNPYRDTVVNNLLEAFCSSAPISLIDARGDLSHQDLAQNDIAPPGAHPVRMMDNHEVRTSDV